MISSIVDRHYYEVAISEIRAGTKSSRERCCSAHAAWRTRATGGSRSSARHQNAGSPVPCQPALPLQPA